MSTNLDRLKQIIEGALLAAGRPLSIDHILSLFLDEEQPTREEIRNAIDLLSADCENRGVEIKEVASGYRFQVKADYAQWVSRLWEEKPARYSRATLETLALIAYRQPITRSEIEDVRGVSVSSTIIKSLLEREWVRVVGHRDVPGKPALYGTTKGFLDYFNLKSLSELPPLAELRNIESIERELDFGNKPEEAENQEPQEAQAEQLEIGHEDEKAIVAAAMDLADSDETVEDASDNDSGEETQDTEALLEHADETEANLVSTDVVESTQESVLESEEAIDAVAVELETPVDAPDVEVVAQESVEDEVVDRDASGKKEAEALVD